MNPSPRQRSRPLAAPGLTAALLLLGLLVSPGLGAAPGCRELRDQRDGLTAQAMQAEITLVIGLRRQLCPREEAAAERAHAEAIKPTPEARTDAVPPLDYAAYLRCRHEAEALLHRTKPALYRNPRGFVFYTQSGAALARSADALQPQIQRSCPAPLLPGPEATPAPPEQRNP